MAQLIDFPTIPDLARGALVVMERGRQIPFEAPRLFLLSGVPAGAERGNHAHRLQHQLLVAVHGGFDVETSDRNGTRAFVLDRPNIGLHAAPLTWVRLRSRADGSTCLVIASDLFEEADYIRDRAEFDRLVGR
jgi:hypothetical protein